jgi:hypothetical protein
MVLLNVFSVKHSQMWVMWLRFWDQFMVSTRKSFLFCVHDLLSCHRGEISVNSGIFKGFRRGIRGVIPPEVLHRFELFSLSRPVCFMSDITLGECVMKSQAKRQCKIKEHERRALSAREAYSPLRAVHDPIPDSADISASRPKPRQFYSIESKAAPTLPTPFRDLLDFGVFNDDDPVRTDIIRLSRRISSSGARCDPETRKFALEFLWTRGRRALQMIRAHIPSPSRQTLCGRPPVGYSRSHLINMEVATVRVRAWRSGVSDRVRGTDCPRWTLACNALACKPSVEVAKDTLTGLDVTDFDLNHELLEFLTSSSEI